MKFAPNPSLIWIKILVWAPVSIWSITFSSNVQLRLFKLDGKANLKDYNFIVYQKFEF